MQKPTIVSITYAIKVGKDVVDNIFKADKKGYKALRQKLKKRDEVKEVQYGKETDDDIKITILTNSINGPSQEYWDNIGDEISNHLWGSKQY